MDKNIYFDVNSEYLLPLTQLVFAAKFIIGYVTKHSYIFNRNRMAGFESTVKEYLPQKQHLCTVNPELEAAL